MMRLPIFVGYTPFGNPRNMMPLLVRLLPRKMSEELRGLIWHSFTTIDYQGLAESVPFISPAAFLIGEVRYQLECDLEEQLVTQDEYSKLETELDRMIKRVGDKTL